MNRLELIAKTRKKLSSGDYSIGSWMQISYFISKVLKILARGDQAYIVALILRFSIKENNGKRKDSCFFLKRSNKPTILALDSKRYRGDLNALKETGEFRILYISQGWYGSIMQAFYDDSDTIVEIITAKKGSKIHHRHIQSLKFIEKVLKYLFLMVNVDCITTVNYRYSDDYDWVISFIKRGIPYVLLYREGMLDPHGRGYFDTVYRTRKFGKFPGQLIIVTNNIMKEAFLESGYCNESQIVVGGSLRMDNLLSRINKQYNRPVSLNPPRRKRFVIFYFPYSVSWFGKKGNHEESDYDYNYAFKVWKGRKLLFKDLHEAILTLAHIMPEVDFIIKPKPEMMQGGSWKYYEEVINNSEFNVNKMNNYIIDSQIDVSDLIINSDVVCAFQSSVVVESAIAGKNIILPLFNNYCETELFKNDFLWSKELSNFDFAETKDDFIELVKKYLKNQTIISDEIMDKRKIIFEKFFNSLNPVAKEIYSNSIKQVIMQARNMRMY